MENTGRQRCQPVGPEAPAEMVQDERGGPTMARVRLPASDQSSRILRAQPAWPRPEWMKPA